MYLVADPDDAGHPSAGHRRPLAAATRENLARLGWKPEVTPAGSFAEARRTATRISTDDWQALVSASRDRHHRRDRPAIRSPPSSMRWQPSSNGKSVVMVTVEADAFCGPLLAQRAAEAGVIYSLAYGDQPALICELVDWARASGFEVTAAGRGHKWLPHYAQSTPETVWKYWGLNEEQAKRGGLNPKMFNSFLDGSKPAIESTAVCQRHRPDAGAGRARLPALRGRRTCRSSCGRVSEGGHLHHKGQVEVRSLAGARRPRHPLRDPQGRVGRVRGRRPSTRRTASRSTCCCTDPSGRYSVHVQALAPDRPGSRHLGRLDRPAQGADRLPDRLPCRRRSPPPSATSSPARCWTARAATRSTASCSRPEKSTGLGSLPLGLAHNVKLLKPIKAGQSLTYADVAMDESLTAVKLRREMEQDLRARPRPGSPRSSLRRTARS